MITVKDYHLLVDYILDVHVTLNTSRKWKNWETGNLLFSAS